MRIRTLMAAALLLAGVAAQAETVKGRVTADGKGLAGVKVSDGTTIVRTDRKGNYTIDTDPSARCVFVCLPAGVSAPQSGNVPRFYSKIAPKVNFQLRRTADDTRHMFVLWADAQVYNPSEVSEYLTLAAADAAKQVSDAGVPAFGVNTGDIVGEIDEDADLFVPVAKAAATSGLDFFYVLGNHDFDRTAGTNEESKETFTSLFGPSWYSFDRGQVHYVVLDDVFYTKRHYIGYLDQKQLDWLRQDLADVKPGSPVVVFMHIPTWSVPARHGDWGGEEANKILNNRQTLYDILKGYDAHLCTGHEHYAENYELRSGLLEHVHAPLSGTFWQSMLSSDGVPWGYYVYEVDGKSITWRYKCVEYGNDKQMTVYPVGADPMKPGCVVANVYNYDPAWKVEWYENGTYRGEMTQYSGYDPAIVRDADLNRSTWRWSYVGAGRTEHLFCATPSDPKASVEVMVTDRFGRVYRQTVRNNTFPYAQLCSSVDGEEALYSLAVDEMAGNIEADGTLRTGKLWSGVWTRDVSYSAILSLAHECPAEVMTSLRRKVDRLSRIIQDTGTGGSWPCSSDREVWTVAAWEVYLATGDKAWLEEVYPICRRSVDSDIVSVYNAATGLFKGESSFIDWRVQSYPVWMQPADIAESECLGTNAVFYKTLTTLARMAEILGEDGSDYAARAEALKAAINDKFWMEDKGCYAMYRYGRNFKVLNPRSETLGEALCILWGIAPEDRAQRIFGSMPVSEFGPTIFWPQISSQGAYHNNAIWPFVTAFYGLAGARYGRQDVVELCKSSSERVSRLFGTNQENLVASTGGIETLLNSPNQLWSIAGFISLYQSCLFGMQFGEDGIHFAPTVPYADGELERSLRDFRYRDATLDIFVKGSGNAVGSFRIDGEEFAGNMVPCGIRGHHRIEITMTDGEVCNCMPNVQKVFSAPEYCSASFDGDTLSWTAVERAASYKVLRDGVEIGRVSSGELSLICPEDGEYAVAALDSDSVEGFICEPVRHYSYANETYIQASRKLSTAFGAQTVIRVKINVEGDYTLDFLYSNGNGDISTYSYCSTRSLYVDGKRIGACVLPQRGDSWDDRGWSTPVTVHLAQGEHSIMLKYERENVNMSIDTDNAGVHGMRITKL